MGPKPASVENHSVANGTDTSGTGKDDDQVALLRIDGSFFFGIASCIVEAVEIAGTLPRAQLRAAGRTNPISRK